MLAILIVLISLAVLTAFLKKHFHPTAEDNTTTKKAASTACSTCIGSSGKCEQECMMEAATQPIEYFDDEELDRFHGKDSADYTEDEACEFADVLHTMRQTEVKDWCRSLTLRGINLPNQLKDEVFMLIED